MTYQRKPLRVEAFQFGHEHRPDWFVKALVQGHIMLDWDKQRGVLHTLTGPKGFGEGDFVVKDGDTFKVYPEETFHQCFIKDLDA